MAVAAQLGVSLNGRWTDTAAIGRRDAPSPAPGVWLPALGSAITTVKPDAGRLPRCCRKAITAAYRYVPWSGPTAGPAQNDASAGARPRSEAISGAWVLSGGHGVWSGHVDLAHRCGRS